MINDEEGAEYGEGEPVAAQPALVSSCLCAAGAVTTPPPGRR
jgi:hypothetical protein